MILQIGTNLDDLFSYVHNYVSNNGNVVTFSPDFVISFKIKQRVIFNELFNPNGARLLNVA